MLTMHARLFLLACALNIGGCAPAYRMSNRTGTPEDCEGCTPRGARAGVRFHFDAWVPDADSSSVLAVAFDDGRQVRATHSTQWNGSPRSRWSPYFETAHGRGDSLRVTAILQTPHGDTLAVGRAVGSGAAVHHPLPPRYRPGAVRVVLSAPHGRR
jgi:hypothetical protein